MREWVYGNAYARHPIRLGERAVWPDGSCVALHDLYQPSPSFMREADLLVMDPPWNLGNLRSFYTKAGRVDHPDAFTPFLGALFDRVAEIRPTICYIEMGKEHLADVILAMRQHFRAVTFFNSTYYHRATNQCYWVRGGPKRVARPLDGMDEADVIQWVATHEEGTCVGDLCLGRGLVAQAAQKAGRRFVGTEINPNRLAVALERLGGYQLEGSHD